MPITVTTNLLASQVPPPFKPLGVPFYRGAAASTTLPPGTTYAPYAQGAPYYSQSANASLVDVVNAFLFGGCGYAITSGFGFATSAARQIFTTPGTAVGPGPLESQTGLSVILPTDNTYYVFLLSTGVLGYSTVLGTPPANAVLYLFQVITSGGVVTAVDNSGVVQQYSGSLRRFTADRCIPSDTPSSGWPLVIETTTQAGLFRWDGTIHRPVGTVVYQAGVMGTVALTALDMGDFFLSPTGNQNVTLPANPKLGNNISITNSALTGAGNLNVYDSTGSILIATLNPGYSTGPIRPGTGGSSSGNRYPSGPITPVPV